MILRSGLRRLFKMMMMSAALGMLTGCIPRRAAIPGYYRIVSIDSQYFELPPNTSSGNGSHLTIPITLSINGISHAQPEQNCSIHGRWFSFYHSITGKDVRWFANTPSADAWAESGGSVDMGAEWETFLRELAILQDKGCFASADAATWIKTQIAERMPLPADSALLYRYSFGPGGYVDLAPGMQLQIERVLLLSDAGGQQGNAKSQGPLTTTYNLVRSSDNGVQLKLIRGGEKDPRLNGFSMKWPDRILAINFKTSTWLRLMLQSVVISGDIKRPAILLGGSDLARLNAATDELVSDPRASCNNIRVPQVFCTEFNGSVAVSPKVGIVVNHRRVYVPVGSKLWSVLPRMSNSSKSTMLKSLRVQRKFANGYVDVRFDDNVEHISQLTLVGGDKISW